MAHVSVSSFAPIGLFNFIGDSFVSLGESIARYKAYKQTRNELSALSDANLRDLGLNRSMIQRTAMEASFAPLK